jgi:hypothetical protein
MVISTLSVITNVFVLVLHHKNVKIQEPMPEWIEKYICGHLAKFLWMERPDNEDGDDEENDEEEGFMKPQQSLAIKEEFYGKPYHKGILTNNR